MAKILRKNAKKHIKKAQKKKPVVELKGFLTFMILHELSQKKLTGEDLAKMIGQRRGSMLTPGTIYPALKNLRKKRLIKFEQFGRRKVYQLLPPGRQQANLFYSLFSKYFAGMKPKIKK